MLEFTKREYANEYSVWCTEEDGLVGELWYDKEKGWHFASFEYDAGYHINDLQDIINKVNELNYFVKYCGGGDGKY
jgi:hypothetical protein